MRPKDLGVIVVVLLLALGIWRGQRRPERATVAAQAQIEPQGRRASAVPAAGGAASVEVLSSAEPAPERDADEIRTKIRDGAPGTYLLDILAEQKQFLMRWPEQRTRAIRVWIDRNPEVEGWKPDYPVVAEYAFNEWKEAGFPLDFDVVPDSQDTSIQIRWVTRLPDGKRIGTTLKTRDQNGWIVAAEITIATHSPTGEPLPSDIVAGIARHEVGHALGLGHSRASSDVMFPESTTPVISASDRATLHLLYSLPPGVVK